MSQPKQSPHWADAVAASILEWQKNQTVQQLHVDDMKTPSGRIHTGSLRGVLLHDVIAKVLQEKDPATVSTYVFNDMDPMDGLPAYLSAEEFLPHMGKPLYLIPKPQLDHCGIDISQTSTEELADFENASNFAQLYAQDFIHALRKLGCTQEIVWSHELYQSGQMDEAIRTALNSVDAIKTVYKEVADYELPAKWYPFQVICEQCGKVGTTTVTDWDGEKVTYTCEPNKVEWAQGCGTTGKISPFGGTGKLLWKVDWPAHWKTMGINIEGAGKDHTSAGGSRDMADALCQAVYHIPVPYDIPYEWILVRGAKMSSSKGVGTSAREFTNLFPPQVGRFLFIARDYKQVIDFDPSTMAIPDLFDEYDQGARIYWGQEAGDQRLARAFELSQMGPVPAPEFLPRFRDVALWMQYPEINVEEKCAEVKGAPLTDVERATLKDTIRYAQIWVEKYAPEEYRFTPKADLPPSAQQLTTEQKAFVEEAVNLVESREWQPAVLQQALFDTAKASVGARQGFQAIYQAFLGKTAGPRAAWFLLSIDPELRLRRVNELKSLAEAEERTVTQPLFSELNSSKLLSIHPKVKERFPSITLAFAVIKNVTVAKTHPQLEQAKTELFLELQGLTTKQINEFSELQSYRRLYKETGVDWHSRRPGPEALLRRLAQGKDFYTINTCVDAYNLVVMKNRVSAGAFNLDQVEFPTELRLAEGGESVAFIGDSETEPTQLKAGELCYFDNIGAYNLDFNYRDALRTQVTEETTNLLINLEGVYDISRTQVETSLQEVIDSIMKYCGGTLEVAGVVTASQKK